MSLGLTSLWRTRPNPCGLPALQQLGVSRLPRRQTPRPLLFVRASSEAAAPPTEPRNASNAAAAADRRPRVDLAGTPLRKHPPRTSVLTKLPPPLPTNKKSLKRATHKHFKSVKTQQNLAVRRIARLGPITHEPPDWRELLRMLVASTPARSTWRAALIHADSTASIRKALLTDELPTSCRSISARTGCVVWATKDFKVEAADERGTSEKDVDSPSDPEDREGLGNFGEPEDLEKPPETHEKPSENVERPPEPLGKRKPPATLGSGGELGGTSRAEEPKAARKSKKKIPIVIYGPPAHLNEAVDSVLDTTGRAIVTEPPVKLVFEAEADQDNRYVRDIFDFDPLDRGRPIKASPQLDVEAWTNPEAFLSKKRGKVGRFRSNSPRKPETMLKVPKVWTRELLGDFIYAALHSVPEPGEQARGGNVDPGHPKKVARLLLSLYSNESTHRAVTLVWFHRAMRYLAEYGVTLWGEVVELFSLAEDKRLVPIGIETFNILLLSAVEARDLERFQAVLHMMHKRGHMPNFRTWLTFLNMFESGEVRQRILGAMRDKGILESPTAARHTAVAMARHVLEASVGRGDSLEAIMASQDRIWGGRDVWLTRRSGCVMLDVLGTYARFDDCTAVLEDVLVIDYPIIGAFNSVLMHTTIQGLVDRTLQVLERAAQCTPPCEPDQITFGFVFDLFWRRKMPLSLAVVWHYAVLSNATDFRMRNRVIQAIEAQKLLSTQDPQLSTPLAGRKRDQSNHFGTVSALYDLYEAQIVPPRPGRPNVWDTLFSQSCSDLVPSEPFHEALRRAVALDRAKITEFINWGRAFSVPSGDATEVATKKEKGVRLPEDTEEVSKEADRASDGAEGDNSEAASQQPAPDAQVESWMAAAPSPRHPEPFVIQLMAVSDTAANVEREKDSMQIICIADYSYFKNKQMRRNGLQLDGPNPLPVNSAPEKDSELDGEKGKAEAATL